MCKRLVNRSKTGKEGRPTIESRSVTAGTNRESQECVHMYIVCVWMVC